MNCGVIYLDILGLLQENWVFTLLAILVVVFIVGMIFRALLKFVMVFIVIGVILTMAFGYTPQEVIQMGKEAFGTANTLYVDTVKPIIDKELANAEYVFNDDGTYEIRTTSVLITGVKGEKTATVYYKDFEFEMDIEKLSGILQEQIQNLEQTQTAN